MNNSCISDDVMASKNLSIEKVGRALGLKHACTTFDSTHAGDRRWRTFRDKPIIQTPEVFVLRPTTKVEKLSRDFIWLPDEQAIASVSDPELLLDRPSKYEDAYKLLYDPEFRQQELTQKKQRMEARFQQSLKERRVKTKESRRGSRISAHDRVGCTFSSFKFEPERSNLTFSSYMEDIARKAERKKKWEENAMKGGTSRFTDFLQAMRDRQLAKVKRRLEVSLIACMR